MSKIKPKRQIKQVKGEPCWYCPVCSRKFQTKGLTRNHICRVHGGN